MTLLQTIKTDLISARKSKDTITTNVLTTLIGEAEAIGKNNGNRETTDAEVIALVKKFTNNIMETLKVLDSNDSRVIVLVSEKKILKQYLPQQLTVDELTAIIQSIVTELNASKKDMGKVLGKLKQQYAGQYDGALAATITGQLLK